MENMLLLALILGVPTLGAAGLYALAVLGNKKNGRK